MHLFSSIASDDDRMRDIAIGRTSTSAISSPKIVIEKRFKQLKTLLRAHQRKSPGLAANAIKPKPRIRQDLLDSRLLFTLDFASPDGATTQALDRAGVFAWLRDEDDPVPPRPVIDELGSHDDQKSVESATTGAQDTEDGRSAASSSSVLGTVQQNLSSDVMLPLLSSSSDSTCQVKIHLAGVTYYTAWYMSGTNPSVVDLKLVCSKVFLCVELDHQKDGVIAALKFELDLAVASHAGHNCTVDPPREQRLLFRKVGDRKPKIVVNQNRQLSRDEIRPGFHYVQGEPNQQYSAERALALSINVVEEQSEDGSSGSHCVTFQLENLDKVACPNQYWFLLDIELGNPVYPDGLPHIDTNLVFTPFTLGLRDRPKAVISARINQWTALEGTITSPDETKVVTFDDQYHPEMVLLSNDQREFGITHMFNVWRSPYE
ncbi:hypothetical protein QFC21_004015 [Naganishia friedmannii]|uniref:Uncharacterized protein n=1 Tax=Naganishia friedmannii TaxID=89922 RepID=A0ACC2VK25_9TREE|nr:hypothetical protein QFC21_004015 [Naganishia friedmannii]